MNSKYFLFSFIYIVLSFSIVQAQELTLFRQTLLPADSELLDSLKNANDDNTLNSIISNLRIKVEESDYSEESKKDLAAFLLKKALFDKNKPYEEFEGLLIEASELLPDNYYVESLWGDLLFLKQNFEDCIKHYESALNSNPEDADIMGLCGLAYVKTLYFEKALKYIEEYLAKSPNDDYFLMNAGLCAHKLNDFEEAINYYEKALEFAKDKERIKFLEAQIREAKEALASTSDSSKDEDQHFIITFAGNSEDDLSKMAFDSLNEIYDEVSQLINCDPGDRKFNVVFFLTEDYYNQNYNWSAASALENQIRVPLKTGYKSEEYVKGVLAHEFTHTMINLKTNNRAPLWIHEGLAQYQEFRTMYGSEENLRSDFVGIYENDFKENGLYIPLEQIPNYMRSKERKDVHRAYIASWLAIRYIGETYGESGFDTLLSTLGKGYSVSEAIKETTGDSYSDFQDDLKQWIQNQ